MEGPLLLELLLPDPPPLPPELLPAVEEELELDLVVPLSDVFALEEMLLDELVLDSTEFCEAVGVFNAEVELILDCDEPAPDDSAEVDAEAGETPLVALGLNRPLLAVVLDAPAPEDDPPVLEACAGTVPVVEG